MRGRRNACSIFNILPDVFLTDTPLTGHIATIMWDRTGIDILDGNRLIRLSPVRASD